jgi:hypothetical protein
VYSPHCRPRVAVTRSGITLPASWLSYHLELETLLYSKGFHVKRIYSRNEEPDNNQPGRILWTHAHEKANTIGLPQKEKPGIIVRVRGIEPRATACHMKGGNVSRYTILDSHLASINGKSAFVTNTRPYYFRIKSKILNAQVLDKRYTNLNIKNLRR